MIPAKFYFLNHTLIDDSHWTITTLGSVIILRRRQLTPQQNDPPNTGTKLIE